MLIVLLIAAYLLTSMAAERPAADVQQERLSLLLRFRREYWLRTGISLTLQQAAELIDAAIFRLAYTETQTAARHREEYKAKALVSSLCEEAERWANYLNED